MGSGNETTSCIIEQRAARAVRESGKETPDGVITRERLISALLKMSIHPIMQTSCVVNVQL